MNTNKAMTILTTRMANNKHKARGRKAYEDPKSFEFGPAEKNSNSCYVYASGVIVPISR